MNGSDLVVIGGAVLAYAMLSRRLAGTVVTAPMVFVAIGILIGPKVLDLLDLEIGSSGLRLLAEATLALVLFSDAAGLDTRRLERENSMPLRMLGLALPMSIALGSVLAIIVFPDLVAFEAVALAVLLAPTDAALGQAVVSDTRLPSVVRQGLNVESGLNDGVCVPLLLAALAFAELEEAPAFEGGILTELMKGLVVAAAVGFAVAVVVAVLSKSSARRGWMAENWGLLVPLATTTVAYAATVELGGSGFIASFVAGLVYGRLLGPMGHQSAELTEDLGQLLSAVTFLLFGAAVLDRGISDIDARTVVYAVLSLTVIRMLPVAISLLGSGAGRATMALAGWFGPRGLATIVFALTVVEESGLDGTRRIVDVAALTVLLSVFAHGMTAPWLIDRYVGWFTANAETLPFEAAEVDIGSHARLPRPRWARHPSQSASEG